MYEIGHEESLLHLTAPHSGNESYTYKRAFTDENDVLHVENAHDLISARTGSFFEIVPLNESNDGSMKFNCYPFYCVGRCCLEL